MRGRCSGRTDDALTQRREKFGEVAERSIAAGCKPAALVATEVRTLPSPPLDSAAPRPPSWQASGSALGGLPRGRPASRRIECAEPLDGARGFLSGVEGSEPRRANARRSQACRADAASRASRVTKAELAAPKCERAEVGEHEGGSNSVVESQPSKLLVAGSIPVSRSILRSLRELRMASPDSLRELRMASPALAARELRMVKSCVRCARATDDKPRVRGYGWRVPDVLRGVDLRCTADLSAEAASV